MTVLANGTYQIYWGSNPVYTTGMYIEVNGSAFTSGTIFGDSIFIPEETHTPFYGQVILDLIEGDRLRFIVASMGLLMDIYQMPPTVTMIKLT